MYDLKQRNELFNNVIEKIGKSNNIIGTYLIGSSSIGFNDIYSDLDFMMAYKESVEPQLIRDEILNFFDEEKIGYIMERKWSNKIWGISIYFKNGLSTDISFGPLEELKIKSNQISVGADTDDLLKKHLKNQIKTLDYKIDQKINWEFMYLIRRFLISIKRNNLIYAYSILNDARRIVMNLQGLNEGKKMHQFKAYNELDEKFNEKILKTIPTKIQLEELEKCKDNLLKLFYETICKSEKVKFEENSKYLLEIADS